MLRENYLNNGVSVLFWLESEEAAINFARDCKGMVDMSLIAPGAILIPNMMVDDIPKTGIPFAELVELKIDYIYDDKSFSIRELEGGKWELALLVDISFQIDLPINQDEVEDAIDELMSADDAGFAEAVAKLFFTKDGLDVLRRLAKEEAADDNEADKNYFGKAKTILTIIEARDSKTTTTEE